MEQVMSVDVETLAWERGALRYVEKGFYYSLLLFAFGLSGFGKEFAYLHFNFGPLPLYVGEIALTFSLIWALLFRKQHLVTDVSRTFWVISGLFLAYGFARTIASFLQYGGEVGAVQILRDSALYYQALWIIFGAALSLRDWKTFISAMLLGVGFAYALDWCSFILNANDVKLHLNQLGSLGRNEVTPPLFWISFIIWPQKWAALLVTTYGRAFFALLFVYFKKTWFFSSFVIVPGVIFAYLIQGRVYTRVSQILKSVLKSFVLGGILVFASVALIVGKVELQKSFRGGLQTGIYGLFSGKTFRMMLQDLNAFETEAESELASFDIAYSLHHDEYRINPMTGDRSLMRWRMHMWKKAWNGFLTAPVFGNGFGPRVVTSVLYGSTITEGRWISGPHNSYLTLAFRMGILGVILFSGMILFGLKNWWQCRKQDLIVNIILACFLAMAFFNIFNVCLENPHNGIWFWMFLGLLVQSNMSKKYFTQLGH